MPQIGDILRAKLSSETQTEEGKSDLAYLFKGKTEQILHAVEDRHTPTADSSPTASRAMPAGTPRARMSGSGARVAGVPRIPDRDILGNRTGKPESGKTVRVRSRKGTAVSTNFIGTTSRWPRRLIEQYLWEVAKIKTRNPDLPKPVFSKTAIALGRLELATQEQLRNSNIFVYRRIT